MSIEASVDMDNGENPQDPPGEGGRRASDQVSSRGRFNPRGVKRKMSNFHVRHRGELLHQRHQPTPVLRI
ncbi:hypothetical protein DSC_08645 [Pseudoxanthomonas spadix BD-a59]|uniref:Uncharacterized protein n=1 Tax=Pseudoxanthomonas spadix (strain BD-a59) TaxID=1045855 RepID=G7UV99_PSEUP|nr:hypothetical protein [Pseudoxanthomonas spadix]AER56379.1 hypothetical protein DSC_08645 [Pseudoxanthomonas spadix BD-a59]